MNFWKTMVLAVSAALIAGCGGGGGGGGGGGTATITGRVVQSTTFLPIQGAGVSLSGGGTAVTGSTGGFSFTASALGAQTLAVQAAGYENASVSVNLQAGDNTMAEPVRLAVASSTNPPDPGGPGTIGGTVTLSGTADASGAVVKLLFGGTVYDSKTTPSSGDYLIWAPIGTYTLRVEKSGYVTREQQVQIADLTQILTVNVTLQKQ